MELIYEVRLNVSDFIDQSENESKELNSVIELCEARILWLKGYDDGQAAGSWFFDGNTTHDIYVKYKKGLEDGDPAYLDQMPQPRLGGEFADDPTWEQVLHEEIPGLDKEWEREDLLRAYEEGFTDGVNDSIQKTLRVQLDV